jgi:hypothetical protein
MNTTHVTSETDLTLKPIQGTVDPDPNGDAPPDPDPGPPKG